MTAARTAGGLIPVPSYKIPLTQGSAGAVRSMVTNFLTSITIDAAGEKLAMVGLIKWADGGTHTVSSAGGSISFYLGASTVWASGSTSVDIGIQDISAGTREPDGTFDVYGTLVPGVETLTALATNTATMESGTKTIADSDLIAVVFDMTARGGTDALPIGGISGGGFGGLAHPYNRFHNAVSWGTSTTQPNVIIKADDGVYGWFEPWGYRPASQGSQAYNSGTGTADEYGARILLPWPVTVEAISVPIVLAGTSGVVVAAGSKTGYSLAAGGAGSGSIAAAELNNIADAVLDRNMATGVDSGSTTVRTPRQALRAVRNKVAISAGTATIYKEDDATASWTAAVTTTAGDPISAIDPAGP